MGKKFQKTSAAILAALLLATTGAAVAVTSVSGQVVVHAESAVKTPPSEIKSCTSYMGYDFKLTFSSSDEAWLKAITSVTVGETTYTKGSSSFDVWNNTSYYADTSACYLMIGEGAVDTEGTCVIKAEGYDDLTVSLNKSAHTAQIVQNSGSDTAISFANAVSVSHDGSAFTVSISQDATAEQKAAWSAWLSKTTAFVLADGTASAEQYGGVDGVTSATVAKNVIYVSDQDKDGYQDIRIYKTTDTTCTIKADGYEDFTLSLTLAGDDAEETQPKYDTITAEITKDFLDSYQVLTSTQSGFVSSITEITVNTTAWRGTSSKMALWGTGTYYLDTAANKIYFDSSALKDGDIVAITTGSGTLKLKVVKTDSDFYVTKAADDSTKNDKKLYVKLVGSFESALVGQEKYDSISGASGSVSTTTNSSVTVKAALLAVDSISDVKDSQWADLGDTTIDVDVSKTTVSILENGKAVDMGMKGVYSTYDSSLTLSGTPTKAGSYTISVTVVDKEGRSYTSNALPFTVYSGTESLTSQLSQVGTASQWDMEPWTISFFDGEAAGETASATVPTTLKTWYGSHESGTYGVLGYAVAEDAAKTQTLYVPNGCSLTLTNMNVLSSVQIVVQKGGKLTLNDSAIQGNIVVENGGTFAMGNSASINGQLLLEDGATLNSSIIYSNTNFIANGDSARHNTKPVVVVNGSVTVTGDVYLRGDEAPTGTDSATGVEYTGQIGLAVNGTLHLTNGAVLSVYGGGHYATTSRGAAAVVMNGGTITGEGTLIAVGGTGTKQGGNAVEGTGTISAAKAYLEGGNSGYKDAPSGNGKTSGITVTTEQCHLVNGTVNGGYEVATYWYSTTEKPDLSLYDFTPNQTTEESTPPSKDETQNKDESQSKDESQNKDETSNKDKTPSKDETPSLPTGSGNGSDSDTSSVTDQPVADVVENDATETTENRYGTTIVKTVTSSDRITKEVYEMKNVGSETHAVVTIQKDSTGSVQEATVEIDKTGATKNGGVQATFTKKVMTQVNEVLGDASSSATVTMTVKDEQCNDRYSITVKNRDLTPNNTLSIYKQSKDGSYVMVNDKAYTTDAKGQLKLNIKSKNDFVLLNQEDADAVTKSILATVQSAKTTATLSKGKTTTMKLASTLNTANVKKITYTSSKSAVATVDKNGKITGKKAGKATIKATVTLKNGATKTVKMTVNVK